MKKATKITATKARNQFFNIVQDAYLSKNSYLIEKNNIPMAYIVPVDTGFIVDEQNTQSKRIKEQLDLLDRTDKLRKGQKLHEDSVKTIRKMRKERMRKYERK